MAAGLPTSSSRGRLTRERIVAAALDTVERQGHESLSLRALGRDLGVTAPAIYDHLDNKEQLLQAVATVGYHELTASFEVKGDTAIDRCRTRARRYVDFARQRPELFRVMFLYRPSAIGIESDNELAAATELFETGLADLAEAMDDGELRVDDPTRLGLTLWAAVHGVASIALVAPPVAEQVADDVIEAMFVGLRPTATAAPQRPV